MNVLENMNVQLNVVVYGAKAVKFQVIEESFGRKIIIPNIDVFHFYSESISAEIYFRNIVLVLCELISEEDNNVFHLNYMSNVNLAKQLKTSFPKCKIILTIHYKNWKFELLGNRLLLDRVIKLQTEDCLLSDFEVNVLKNLDIEKNTLSFCDYIVCLSSESKNELEELYGFTDNITIIPNATKDDYVELDGIMRDRLRKKYMIASNVNVILFVGRLELGKGLEFLINSFKVLLLSQPNSVLIICGSGDFEKYLDFSNPIWSKIIFTGFLDKQSLYELYLIADIGVIPSLHEEFCYVGIEMAMFKLPFLISDIGGVSNYFTHNVSCIKIPVKMNENNIGIDAEKIAFHLDRLISDTEFSSNIGYEARKIFIDKLNLPKFNKKMNEFYIEVIKQFNY